jgi:type IX secretion system PorP/SprF family membrane protein
MATMRNTIYRSILIGCLFTSAAAAQDHHFSQYDAGGMLLNPALTGMFGNETYDFNAGLQHRDQWRGLSRKPFTRSAGWFSAQLHDRYGYGAFVSMDKAGSSGYRTLNVMISGAYDIMNPDYRRKHQLSVGLQLGILQRSFDPTGYVFDSQYTGTDQIFDTSMPTGENFVRTSLLGFDANMGVYYVNKDRNMKARPFGGLMFAHLSRPLQSFTDVMDKSPMRLAVNGGAEVDIMDELTLTPHLLYMAQGGVSQINTGIMAGYSPDGSDYTFMLGGGVRLKDALIIQTGVKYKTTIMRLSYDRNTSDLKTYTGGMGGWEISLSHGFFRK